MSINPFGRWDDISSSINNVKLPAASASEYGSGVYLIFKDSHYANDGSGSQEEYVK